MSGTVTDRRALAATVRTFDKRRRLTWDQAMAEINRRHHEITDLALNV